MFYKIKIPQEEVLIFAFSLRCRLIKKDAELYMTVKVFFNKLLTTILTPWNIFKTKAPLFSFIVSRVVTMIVLLFLLGFALFALMDLAPGDIVDQMMSQQIMSSVDGSNKANTSNFATNENTFSVFEPRLKALPYARRDRTHALRPFGSQTALRSFPLSAERRYPP